MIEKPGRPIPIWAKVSLGVLAVAAIVALAVVAVQGKWIEFEVHETNIQPTEAPRQ